MKKVTAIIAIFILGTVLLCGCSFLNKEEPTEAETIDLSALYGTWAEDTFDSGFVFWEDGYGLDTFWNLYFEYTATENTVTMTYDSDTYGVSRYNYTVSGNVLTMTRIDTQDTDTFTYYKSDAEYERPVIPETDENGETITTVTAESTDEATDAAATSTEAEAEIVEEVPAEGEAEAEGNAEN